MERKIKGGGEGRKENVKNGKDKKNITIIRESKRRRDKEDKQNGKEEDEEEEREEEDAKERTLDPLRAIKLNDESKGEWVGRRRGGVRIKKENGKGYKKKKGVRKKKRRTAKRSKRKKGVAEEK